MKMMKMVKSTHTFGPSKTFMNFSPFIPTMNIIHLVQNFTLLCQMVKEKILLGGSLSKVFVMVIHMLGFELVWQHFKPIMKNKINQEKDKQDSILKCL